MPKAGRKIILILVIFSSLLTLATANDLVYNVTGTFEQENSHKFVFENRTSLNDPYLNIENPRGKKSNFTLQENNSKLFTNVSSSFFEMKGVYRFDFYSDQGKLFTPGDQTMVVGSANTTWKNRMDQLASDDSNNRCSSGEYLCFDEYYQSKTIISATQAFRLTGDQKYIERALNYSLADWSGAQQYACGGYDCSDFDGFNTSGSMRQGSAIYSLWSVYSATGNTEVRSKAVNYTQGSPEECDVWNDVFDCGNATNQAYMMKGFWKAYEVTDNSSYRQKAVSLTEEAFNESYNSSEIVSALSTAYQTTGNTSYRKRAFNYNLANAGECSSSCEDWEKLRNIKSGLEMYKATGNSFLYRYSVNNVSNLSLECLKSTSSNCTYPDQQSDASQVSGLLYSALKNQSDGFVNPVLEDIPSRNGTLDVKSGIEGSPSNPEVKVYDSNNILEDRCSLNNFNNSCKIDFSSFEQGIYSLELESTDSTYERQIPVTYSQRDINIEQELTNFTESSPQEACDPWNNTYSCVKDDIRYQSYYIGSFADLSRSYKNRTYNRVLGSLSKPPYNYTDGLATCLPESNDFSCANSFSINASEKQGSMIEALFESYQETGNVRFYELAENYSSTSSEDGCRVWKDEYTCQSPEAQGIMIQGYWEAYEVTGNSTYKNISLELVNNSNFDRAAPELAEAFWESFTWTNNSEYKEEAFNITQNLTNSTECPSCDTEKFLDQGSMILQAYRTTANETFSSKLENYTDNLDNICTSGSCSNPLIQGKAISFTSTSMNTLPVDIDIETSLNISSNTIKVDEKTNVTCSITNTMQDTDTGPIDISILPDSSFNESEMNTTTQSLSYNQKANFTRNITGITSGDGIVECRYTSPDFTVENSGTVTIEKIDTGDDDSDNSTEDSPSDSEEEEDTGGSFFPPQEPTEPADNETNTTEYEPRTIEYSYNNTSLENDEVNLPREYKLTRFRTYSCFNASRTFYKNKTVLNVSSCNNITALVYENSTQTTILQKFTDNASFNFSTTENQTKWSKPAIYELESIPLRIQTSSSQETTETRNETKTFEFSLNSRQKCELSNNGEIVENYNSRDITAEVELSEGDNEITLDCGETSKSMTVAYNKPLKKKAKENTGFILFGLLLFSFGVVGWKRRAISSFYHEKLFEFRYNRFRKALNNEEAVEAVEQYKKMSGHENSEELQQKVFNSDLKMLKGLKMYIMADMISDPEIELSQAERNRIQNSINDFISSHKNTRIADKIKSNM